MYAKVWQMYEFPRNKHVTCAAWLRDTKKSTQHTIVTCG